MDNKNAKDGNNNSLTQSKTQDNLSRRLLVQVFDTAAGMQVSWRGINSLMVETVLLNAYRQMVYYNIKKSIEEKDKPKIFKPNVNDIIAATRKI